MSIFWNPFRNNRGFWSTIIDIGKRIFDKVTDSSSDAVGTSIGGKIGDKINGIPNPMSGAEAGQWQKDYMDRAYPGATVPERLGVGGQSGNAVQGRAIAEENRRMNRQLATESMIADQNNRTSVLNTSISAGLGPEGIRGNMEMYNKGNTLREYDTKIDLDAQRLQSELKLNDAHVAQGLTQSIKNVAEAQQSNQQSRIISANAELASRMAKANLNEMQSRIVHNYVESLAGVVNAGSNVIGAKGIVQGLKNLSTSVGPKNSFRPPSASKVPRKGGY